MKRFMPSVFTPISADTIEGLAEQLSLDPQATAATVAGFNAACPEGPIDQSILDGKATQGLTPEKQIGPRRLQKNRHSMASRSGLASLLPIWG